MNAGLLTERIALYQCKRFQTPSGYEEEQEALLYRCRAYVRKHSYQQDRDRLTAGEVFDPQTLSMQVREDKRLEQAQELEYKGRRYIILMAQSWSGRTVLLTCKLKDL